MLADLLTHLYALSRGMRRLYAALMLLVIAIPVLLAGSLALSMITGSYSFLEERRIYLGNLLLLADAGKGVEDTQPEPKPGTDEIFLAGKNREVISADLQNWLNSATQNAGAELQSIENSASDSDGKQAYIGLSANVFGAWKPIQNVIFRIETAQPVLFVRDLEIHAASYGDDRAEPQVTMRIAFRGVTRIAGERP